MNQHLMELASIFETCIPFLPPVGQKNVKKAVEELRGVGSYLSDENVSAYTVFRIAGGDVECCPNPTGEQAIECLTDLRQCYDDRKVDDVNDATHPRFEAGFKQGCRFFDLMFESARDGETVDNTELKLVDVWSYHRDRACAGGSLTNDARSRHAHMARVLHAHLNEEFMSQRK